MMNLKKSLIGLMLFSTGPLYASSRQIMDEIGGIQTFPVTIKATVADSFFQTLIPALKAACNALACAEKCAQAASGENVTNSTRSALDDNYKKSLNTICGLSFNSVWQNRAVFSVKASFQPYDIFFDRTNTTLRMEVPSLNLANLGLQGSHLSTQSTAMAAVSQLQGVLTHLTDCEKKIHRSHKMFLLISLNEEEHTLKKLNKQMHQTQSRIDHLKQSKTAKSNSL